MEASVAQPAVSTRRRGSLSEASSAFLSQVQEIIEGMKPYWPLTLRQVYYQCVSAMILENNLKSYQKLSRLLVKARLDGRVSWEAMEDRSRTFNDRPQTVDFDEYVYSETAGILSTWGYRINPMDDQPVPLEMWVEKDALAGIIEPIAAQFSVPLVVARGNASVSFLSEFRYRVLRNRLHHEFEDRPTRVLYLGDLDPSGWFMFPHSLITLRDEMDLGDLVQHVRLGLNPEQVEEHNLPQDPTAFKEADANAKRYRAIHGELAVELDALHPKVLTALAMEGIEANLDLDRLAATRQRQEQGRDRLKELAQKARRAVRDALGGDYE